MPKVISFTDICGKLWLGMPSHDVSLSGGCKVLEKSTLKHCILQLNVKAIEECFFLYIYRIVMVTMVYSLRIFCAHRVLRHFNRRESGEISDGNPSAALLS